MNLQIITPDKSIYKGEAISVVVPGSAGSFEILKQHAPIISTLDDGKVIVRQSKGVESTFYIKGGVVEVLNDNIIVLADGILNREASEENNSN
ncbi:ATP synthase F1 subunit epsilon [Olivibacter sitiensis]|uniref:ATP synthase F1 subunit epsilon n=1 Tax=Olivibacter sitiensis TaxID=376470 RepID=UPI000401BCA8|nr:ATP synthase F1 subunit epsilon [Olivibacter sitiensis]